MNKNTIIAALTGAVVVLFGVYLIGFFTPVSITPSSSSVPDVNLGAMPGDTISGNYFSVGGVKYYSVKSNVRSATSTACSMPAPPNATSTLIDASVTFKTGSSSAVTIGFAKASSFAASTTALGGTYALGANTQVTLNASTTPTAMVGSAQTFRPGADGPDKFLNVFFYNATGATNALSAPKGSCQGLWKLDQ
jgi:hypothetical protein